MRKLLVSGGMALFVALIAGCMTMIPGLGEEFGDVALPEEASLLDSDEGECDGTLQISNAGIEGNGNGLGVMLLVDAGENATFQLDGEDTDIEWACTDSDGGYDQERTDCPSGTTHVRITRATSGGEVLLECYG